MYTVYIVACADGTLYTGITTNLQRRLAEHNSSSKGAKYTRTRRPVTFVYTKKCRTRSIASAREAAIKKLSRREKIRLFAETKLPK
jgi:putative endonuclease